MDFITIYADDITVYFCHHMTALLNKLEVISAVHISMFFHVLNKLNLLFSVSGYECTRMFAN